MKKIQFEAGDGTHFPGGVNYLISTDRTIYAECPVPDERSEDYGYLTMKRAILAAYHGTEPLAFWYDGQEQCLDADASAECEVYVDIEEDERVTVINAAGREIDFEAAVQMMDDEIRERLHAELAPCTEQEFFTVYEAAHLAKFGEEWELSKANPVW